MAKKAASKYNENYAHECASELVSRADLRASFVETNYSLEELKAIIDFYITNSPIKNAKDANGSGRWLGEYGWIGASDLRSLESKLLRASGITSFIILKSSKANETIKAMKLGDEICVEHPRAVLTQECRTTVNEDGSISNTTRESRMACLFRHIRNAIAHGQSHVLPNNNLILDDKNDFGKTASMLIPSKTLVDWIRVVDKEGSFYPELRDDRNSDIDPIVSATFRSAS